MADTRKDHAHVARIDQLLEMLARQKAEFERLASSANDAAIPRGRRPTIGWPKGESRTTAAAPPSKERKRWFLSH